VGFWEKALITFFVAIFHLAHQIRAWWAAIALRSMWELDAFQLMKRSAYEASGTHPPAGDGMIDDMKLGN